jgi:hypothetical protein
MSVEQILGWERWCGDPAFGHWVDPATKTIHREATADDLADWLDKHSVGWDVWKERPGYVASVGVATTEHFAWPTIFGALEAAVRHVHEATA